METVFSYCNEFDREGEQKFMKIRLNSVVLGIVLASMALTGCSLYRVDVQQGNVIKESQVQQLKPGLSREEVRNLLGTPALADPFHVSRWDYAYSFKPSYGSRQQKHLSLFFDSEGRLTRTEGELKLQTP